MKKVILNISLILMLAGCAQQSPRPVETAPPIRPLTSTSVLEESAAEGDAKAQHDMAILYAAGVALPQDNQQALYWLRKSVAQDYAPAQHYLGAFYYGGEFVEQDLAQAKYWFNKAAEQGYAPALRALSEIKNNAER